jgi:hypothetical protein
LVTGDRLAQAKYCHKFEDYPPKIPQVNVTGSKGSRERERLECSKKRLVHKTHQKKPANDTPIDVVS